MYIHYKERIAEMKKWLQRSLKNQLVLFISLAVMIPVGIFGIISYTSAVQVSKERANISGESSLSQLQNSLDFIVDDMLSMSVFLIGNRDVQAYMEDDSSTPRQKSNIAGFLSNLAYSKQYISNITLYPNSANPDISTNPRHKDGSIKFTNYQNTWWAYRTFEETVSGKQETITLSRPVRSLNGFHDIGYLSISLNRKYVEALLQSAELEWGGTVLLFTEDLLLASNNKQEEMIDLSTFDNDNVSSSIQVNEEHIDNNRYIVFSTAINEVDWQLTSIIPYKEFSHQNKYLLWLTVCMMAVALILIILLSWFVISKVLDPLLVLSDSLKQTTPGDPLSILPITPKNEIGHLITNYNKLNDRIVYLMEQIKTNEALKRQVDLQALQHQINPHFLYNTLASIHWMALRTNEQKISEMVSSLSTYLRYSLNRGNEYATITQEVELLQNYVTVQQIRFPNRFDILIDIPHIVEQERILKLILQPLVENSITHGLEQVTKKRISIHIQASIKRDMIQFIVSDNGIGMKPDVLDQLHTSFQEDKNNRTVIGEHYGLRNVNLRLLLHYGQSSHLQIKNNHDGGLMVRFNIPIRRETK